MKILKMYIVFLLSVASLVASDRLKVHKKLAPLECQRQVCRQQATLIGQLLAQNQQLQHQLFDQQQEKQRLVSTLRYKNEMIVSIKAQRGDLQAKCKLLFESCNISQEDLRERQKMLEPLKLENASLQQKIHTLEVRLREFQARLARKVN